MDKELEVLNHIANSEDLTQRKLAQIAGLSLGAANILLKRLVKKGHVKIEKINSKTLKYILTPSGVLEKTKRTYEYIAYSYNYVKKADTKIKQILLQYDQINRVYLFGIKNEIFDLIASALKDINKNYEYLQLENIRTFDMEAPFSVFTWDMESANILADNKIPFINIILDF